MIGLKHKPETKKAKGNHKYFGHHSKSEIFIYIMNSQEVSFVYVKGK